MTKRFKQCDVAYLVVIYWVFRQEQAAWTAHDGRQEEEEQETFLHFNLEDADDGPLHAVVHADDRGAVLGLVCKPGSHLTHP